jgi:hypothetical protein
MSFSKLEQDLHFSHCPRFDKHELSEDQILAIAKKAVELAREDMYNDVKKEFTAEVGRSVIDKFSWLVGIVVVSLFFWLQSKGFLKL